MAGGARRCCRFCPADWDRHCPCSLTITQLGSLVLDQGAGALQTCFQQSIPQRAGMDLVQNDPFF